MGIDKKNALSYDTVLFDLDGTILDTNELILQTFYHVLGERLQTPETMEMLILHMGRPLHEQFQLLTGQDDVNDFIRQYRAYNHEIHDEYVREFPYVSEVLTVLQEYGVRMGVVTTKMRKTTIRSLQFCDGLDRFMSGIVTVDDVEHAKPHPEPVLKAVNILQADPARTVMVGDSPFDIQAAKAAGVTSIGVGWSLKGEDALSEYEPDYIIRDMRELPSIVGIVEE